MILLAARLSHAVASSVERRSEAEDIDVEHVGNDSSTSHEARKPSGSSPSSPKAATMPKKRKDEKPRMRNKCNCEELRYVDCILETKDLWDKFHDYETEMIITKTGR